MENGRADKHRVWRPHTQVWAAKIDSFDAYVFVTPEYNHATSGERRLQAASRNEKAVNDMLDQVIAWSGALKTLRREVNGREA